MSGLSKPALTLKYDHHVLCAPRASGGSEQKLTRGLVGKVLGPTYDSKGVVGELRYPGISFCVGGKKGGSGDREDVVDQVVVCPKDGEGVERGLTSCIVMVSSVNDSPKYSIVGRTDKDRLEKVSLYALAQANK